MEQGTEVTHVLFDVDGVIRHYEASHVGRIELTWGLPGGAIQRAAFQRARVQRLVTGAISRSEWIREIGESVGSPGAAREWDRIPVTVDGEVIRIARQLTARGRSVSILSNGSDRLRKELADLGVAGCFDVIVNSAEIGVAKPDPGAYLLACDLLGVTARQVLLVDDSRDNIVAAAAVGMAGIFFHGAVQLRSDLVRLGLVDGASQ